MKPRSLHRSLLVVVSLLLILPPSAADLAALRGRLSSLVAHPGLRGAGVGVEVADLATGEVLFDYNALQPLTPASVMKLVSGATALEYLGPEHVFLTTAAAADPIGPDGALAGDLYLVGSGDPTVQTADLKALAAELRQAGLRRVSGNIMADAGCFADMGPGSGWDPRDEDYRYAAEIAGLALNWNALEVAVVPAKSVGRPAEIRTIPRTGYVGLENSTRTVSGSRRGIISADRRSGTNILKVSGTIGRWHAPVTCIRTVHEPDLYAACVFREALVAAGIAVEGQHARGRTPEQALVLAQHQSKPLRDIFVPMMKHSANLTAECLYRTASFAVEGQGSAFASARLACALLEAAGADTGPLVLADASGLSRRDRLTADCLVRLLRYMWLRGAYPDVFVDALPIAAVDGTLKKRMAGTRAANNLRAKTGTLTGVCSLAGYVVSADGELLCFAILMSGYQGGADRPRRIQDQMGVALAEFRR